MNSHRWRRRRREVIGLYIPLSRAGMERGRGLLRIAEEVINKTEAGSYCSTNKPFIHIFIIIICGFKTNWVLVLPFSTSCNTTCCFRCSLLCVCWTRKDPAHRVCATPSLRTGLPLLWKKWAESLLWLTRWLSSPRLPALNMRLHSLWGFTTQLFQDT